MNRSSCFLTVFFVLLSWFQACICHLQSPGAVADTNGATAKKRIAVLGASGYTGEEVVRLLALHPNLQVTALTGESQAGKVRQLHFWQQGFSMYSVLSSHRSSSRILKADMCNLCSKFVNPLSSTIKRIGELVFILTLQDIDYERLIASVWNNSLSSYTQCISCCQALQHSSAAWALDSSCFDAVQWLEGRLGWWKFGNFIAEWEFNLTTACSGHVSQATYDEQLSAAMPNRVCVCVCDSWMLRS